MAPEPTPPPTPRRSKHADDDLPNRRRVTDERAAILAEYGLKPDMPLTQKVERLYDKFALGAEEIDALLELNGSQTAAIEAAIAAVEERFEALGGEQTAEQKRRHRGRAISRLEAVQTSLQERFERTGDPALASRLTGIENQILMLRGIDTRRVDASSTQIAMSELENAIAGLSLDYLTELRTYLDQSGVTELLA